ncbi:hypothetical protein AB1Y20_019190 [Prymnesium parvum]|uniref:RRM domain-containing protein n=1 Tax=Prymnesium parvum TaxID=97485 RepID=A0AB34JTE7_PRYPA
MPPSAPRALKPKKALKKRVASSTQPAPTEEPTMVDKATRKLKKKAANRSLDETHASSTQAAPSPSSLVETATTTEKKKKKKRAPGEDDRPPKLARRGEAEAGRPGAKKKKRAADDEAPAEGRGGGASAWDEGEGGASDGKRRRAEPLEAKPSKERIACTVFVGQLPYSASEADVRRHFKACAADGEVRVRLLTKRAEQGGGSRGMAFVELSSEAAVHTALRLHHSVMAGRRINVERTVGGGGASGERKQKLDELREKQGKQMVLTVKEMCDSILPAAEGEEEGEDEAEGGHFACVTRADIDERVLEFLCTVPTSLAEESLREIKALDMNGVRNRSAYVMGVLKRRVAESDSVKKPDHGASGKHAHAVKKGNGDARSKGGSKSGGKGRAPH